MESSNKLTVIWPHSKKATTLLFLELELRMRGTAQRLRPRPTSPARPRPFGKGHGSMNLRFKHTHITNNYIDCQYLWPLRLWNIKGNFLGLDVRCKKCSPLRSGGGFRVWKVWSKDAHSGTEPCQASAPCWVGPCLPTLEFMVTLHTFTVHYWSHPTNGTERQVGDVYANVPKSPAALTLVEVFWFCSSAGEC